MWRYFECYRIITWLGHKCPYNCGKYMMDETIYIHIQVHPYFNDPHNIMLFSMNDHLQFVLGN
jgi:hypothetical protein